MARHGIARIVSVLVAVGVVFCAGEKAQAETLLFGTGWENRQSPGYMNRVEDAMNVAGYFNTSNPPPECGRRKKERVYEGDYSLLIAGYSQSATAQCYYRLFDEYAFPVVNGMKISYWIFHAEGTPKIALDGQFTDGTPFRTFNSGGVLTDQNGVWIHPAARRDPMNKWYYVEADLSRAAGKTIAFLMFSFDNDARYGGDRYVGRYRAYVDDLRIVVPDPPPPAVPAFPEAEGFGAISVGGRYGRVFEVTNLNDAGAGSLRAAIEAIGPRTVVFRTSGTIELQDTLTIFNPYITIAGQTAPGDGIALKNEALEIRAHDVIVRHLRSRPGPTGEVHGIEMGDGASRVVIDHCSVSWGVDEDFSIYGSNDYTDDGRLMSIRDITLQWSIFSEALHDSVHSKGPHSMGMMLGKGGGNLSVHHNLLAHNNERNPRIKTSGGPDGIVDFVNNVIYNFGAAAGMFSDDYGKLHVNYVGNYLKRGRDSHDDCAVELTYMDKGCGFAVFAQDNILVERDGSGRRQARFCTSDEEDDAVVQCPESEGGLVPSPHPAPPVRTTSADEAYQQVRDKAGATLPRRDAVDRRILSPVATGEGRIIDDPTEVGGWPVLASAEPPADSDHDGMSDAWEERYGFNPSDPSDGPQDADGDGYTNLEEYLNGTFPVIPAQPRVAEISIPSDGGTYFYEENTFVSSYAAATSTAHLKEMRLLISSNLTEEDNQFYGVVIQESAGVFKAYLHDDYSRYPTTRYVPGQGWLGGYPIGVGQPMRNGLYVENRWARWNVGESYLTIDPNSKTIRIYWNVIFHYDRAITSQGVFAHVTSKYGEVDSTSPDHVIYGWHRKGTWSIWGVGPVVMNPSFELDAAGSTRVPSYWWPSPGTPWNTRFELVTQPVTHGTRSLKIETVPSNFNYYQGIWQNTPSPGPGKSVVFSCDLSVARGTVVINVYTYDPFPNVVWLGYAVVNSNGGFQRVEVPFRTLAPERYTRLHYRIDGIQPPNTTETAAFYVDNVSLAVK